MPELDGYESEILHGVYRTDLYNNTQYGYHRTPPSPGLSTPVD
jgi:hypothetical protein